jgi:hypothetical protein
MSEVLTAPAAALPEVPAPPAPAVISKEDRIDLRGEGEGVNQLIVDLRRKSFEMGARIQQTEIPKGVTPPIPVWENGTNGALRRLLAEGRNDNANTSQAAEQERSFLVEMTRRTTLQVGEAVGAKIEWPGFGECA